MSELVSADTAERSDRPNGPDEERRQARRVGLSLELRIRPACFGEGHSELIQTTRNASSQGFYFVTWRNCYREGMLVRVSSRYGPVNGSGQWEDTGEVLRVDARPGGYGVVIRLHHPRHLASSQATPLRREQAAARTERRSANRVAFMAYTEVTDMRTGFLMNARISDLSRDGCYVDTLNPLPSGTSARLQIRNGHEVLCLAGRVVCRHTASGMGLAFEKISEQERKTLEGWLVRHHRQLDAPAGTPPAAARTETAACAERLVDLLVHKGLLTRCEASALLGGNI